MIAKLQMEPIMNVKGIVPKLTVTAGLLMFACIGQCATALPPATRADEVRDLQQAYQLLNMADHDYKGHRVKAMHAIEEACKLLEVKATGHAKGHERQRKSDAQLQEAQALLEAASKIAASADQKKVLGHIERGLREISIALAIK